MIISFGYIDTSVYLDIVFGYGDESWEYLRLVGYKNRNKGLISNYVLGEIMNEMLHEIKNENPHLELEIKKASIEILDKLITEKENSDDLDVVSFSQPINNDFLETLLKIDRNLTYDDTLHLAVAVQNGCDRFVTCDSGILESNRLNSLLKKRGLKMKGIAV